MEMSNSKNKKRSKKTITMKKRKMTTTTKMKRMRNNHMNHVNSSARTFCKETKRTNSHKITLRNLILRKAYRL